MKIQALFKQHFKWLLVAVLLCTTAAYANTLGNQFLWDDGYFIGFDKFHNLGAHWQDLLKGEMPMSASQLYRPFRSFYYVLAIQLWGNSQTFGYHLQAILVHLTITTLVFFITQELLKKREVSLITTTLFGLHPIHTEAVAWITASFDTIGILFFFAAFYSFLRFRRGKEQLWKRLWYICSFVAFFSYELTFVLVPLILIYDWLSVKTKVNLKQLLKKSQFMWLLVGLYVLVRLTLPQNNTPVPYLFSSFTSALLFTPVLIAHYLKLMLLPLEQSINHTIYPDVSNLVYQDSFPHHPPSLTLLAAEYWLPVLSVAVYGLFVWRIRKNKQLLFLSLWPVVSLLPVLQLIPQTNIFAERYTYIASYGIVALIAYGLAELVEKYRFVGLAATLALVSLCAWLTIQRNQVWQDMFSFWGSEADKQPASAYVLRQLAAGYYMNKEYDKAVETYARAVALRPDSEAYFKMGYLRYLQQQCAVAEEYLMKSLEFEPQRFGNLNYIGDCYQQMGNAEKARQFFEQSLKLNPYQLDIQNRLKQE